jgi:hypothetical protein
MLKVERDPVLVEAIKILKEDSKNSKDHHIYDDDGFDLMYDDNDDEDFDDDNIIDGDYGDDYMGL